MRRATEQITRIIRFTRDYQDIGILSPYWQDLCDVIEAGRKELNAEQVLVSDEIRGISIFADPMIVRVFYNLIENASVTVAPDLPG
jgi:hypothetical protein